MSVFQKLKDRTARMSIKTKLMTVITLSAALAVVAGQYSQFQERKRAAVEEVTLRYDLATDLLAAQLVAPTQFQDADRLYATIKVFADKDPNIVAADVVGPDGKSIFQFNADGERAEVVTSRFADVSEAYVADPETANVIKDLIFATKVAITAPNNRGTVGFLQLAVDMTADREKAINDMIGSGLRSVLAAIFALVTIVLLVSRVVTRPVLRLSDAMEKIAESEYSTDIPFLDRHDEIGGMASRLANFRDRLAEQERRRAVRAEEEKARTRLFDRLGEGLAEIADGRVDRKIDVDEFTGLDDSYLRICRDFNDVLDNLQKVLLTVTRTAETVRANAQEISESVVDQSKRSEAQAVTLEESAAAIETLSSSVEQTAEHAAEANKRITQNRQQAQAGGEVVEQTVEAMRNIEQSSDQITAIIGVIDDIAFQTNLLALNAGVEAARAGEAGRGFAVVASEVRALAQRASDSANEIKELIQRSGEQVTKGSELVNKAGEALQEIITGVNHASGLVSQIATGSRDQADNLSEIKESVTELDRVTQRNAAMIEESSAASRNLSQDAANMTDVLQVFKLTGDSATSKPKVAKAAPAKVAQPKPSPKPAPKAEPKAKAAKAEDVAKTKEWDDDAAMDAKSAKAEASPKPTKPKQVAKKTEAPKKPVSKVTEEEPVLQFSSRGAASKSAVNQTAVATASEDWEDF